MHIAFTESRPAPRQKSVKQKFSETVAQVRRDFVTFVRVFSRMAIRKRRSALETADQRRYANSLRDFY